MDKHGILVNIGINNVNKGWPERQNLVPVMHKSRPHQKSKCQSWCHCIRDISLIIALRKNIS